jgi:hypothetical protein
LLLPALSCFSAASPPTPTGGLLSARRAALAGAVALAANLTYQYALQGAVKEIGLLATLCAGVAVGREAIKLGRPYAGAVMLAVVAAAAMATYDAVAVPFLGALLLFLGLGLMFVRRLRPRLDWSGPLVVGLGLAVLLSIPSLVSFKTFFNVASAGQGTTGVGATQFGQLLRVLPLSQLSGVWLAGEYRLAIASHHAGLLTTIATLVVFLAIVPCVVWALERRQVAVLVAIGMVGLVMLIVFPRVSPYAQGKLLAVCSPIVVLAGVAGLLGMGGLPGTGGRRAGLAGLLAACGVSLAILASDVLAYSHARVAPTAQMEAIGQTGDRFAGRGLVLWNEFQEYAKYFARAAKISVPFEALTPQQVQLRLPTYFYGRYFDLDEELLPFVEGYPIVVTRRSPSASRPPANYKLVYQNAYYLGWERTSAPRVLEHLPLQQQFSPSLQVQCSALGPIVAKAPHGSELVVATAPEVSWFVPISDLKRSGGWAPDPNLPGVVETRTGGHAEGVLHVKRAGAYRVWVQGDFPRPVQVQIDGRTVGSVSGANTPGQWLQAATVHLRPGRYPARVVMVAGHRHFGPGEWWPGTLGAVELQSTTPGRMSTLALSRWRTLCGREADWVEVVRP